MHEVVRRDDFATIPLRPMSVPEIFDRSVALIVRSAVPIVSIGFVYGAIPSTIVENIVGALGKKRLPAQIPIDFFGVLMDAITSAALVYILVRSTNGEATGVGEAFAAGIRFGKATIVNLMRTYLAMLLVLCGLLAIVAFPIALLLSLFGVARSVAINCGFIVAVAATAAVIAVLVFAFFMATSISIATSATSGASLKLARRFIMAKTQRKRAFGMALGATAPAAIIIGLGLAAADNATIPSALVSVVENLTLIAGTSYAAANAVLFARDARIRLEGFDIEVQARALTNADADAEQ